MERKTRPIICPGILQTIVAQTKETYTEEYIRFITKHAVSKAMTRNEIAKETKKDEFSNLLGKAIIIISGIWEDNRLKNDSQTVLFSEGHEYFFLKLREQVISIVHESHHGSDKTKALLREKVMVSKNGRNGERNSQYLYLTYPQGEIFRLNLLE